MKRIRVLDCTLRDGGRIINCEFLDAEIREISLKLANAKIDIIEVGFLRDWNYVNYNGNSTFFTDIEQIQPFVDKRINSALYVAFVDFGMFDINSLKPFDGKSIDGIRLGFTKKNYFESKNEVLHWAKVIKEKGYKLFVQGVNSLSYTDREILEIVDMVNELHPYSFGIVDTYGAMYIDDVDRLYRLIDNNMLEDICINFHSHNNYQLSFALAQEIIKLGELSSREIIIDGTLGGMGKVAGNLNTELIVDYLVRKKHYNYELENVLDILDNNIYKYSLKHEWGYSTAAMMAGIYKSHPNNVLYMLEKFRLDTKDIGNILSMIAPEKRQMYDYDNIEKIYMEYVADKIDDYDTIQKLKGEMEGKEIFILVPGNSLNTHAELIKSKIEHNNYIIISVNFMSGYENSYSFFGNAKRYARLEREKKNGMVIISSNMKRKYDEDLVVNYHSLINRGYRFFENSTIMLLNLLKKINPSGIVIAGFDGFDAKDKNYMDISFQNERHLEEFETLNKEISAMFKEIREIMSPSCSFEFITPSIYDSEVV